MKGHRLTGAGFVLLLTLITLTAIQVMLSSKFQVGSYHDDASYINLAHALGSRQGYTDIALVQPQPHRLYPPIYPLLLTPFLMTIDYEWLLQTNFLPLQLLSLALVALCLVFLFTSLRRVNPQYAAVVTCVVALNPIVAGTTIQVMSEAPYMFFSLVALWAVTLWKPGREKWLVVAAAATALASLTRVIGVALLISFVLFAAFMRQQPRKAWLLMAAISFLPIAGWMVRSLTLGSSALGGYRVALEPAQSSNYVTLVLRNLYTITFITIPNAILPGLTGPQVTYWLEQKGIGFVSSVIGATMICLVVLGYYRQWRDKKTTPQELYVPVYLGILMITSFALEAGERYLVPILPFLLLYLFGGIASTVSWVVSKRGPATLPYRVVIVCAIGLIGVGVFRDIQGIVNPVRARIPDISLGTSWLRENTNPQSIVMAQREKDVYLYSQRKVELFPSQLQNAEELASYIPCAGTDYVLVQPDLVSGLPFHWSKYTEEVVLPAIASRPDLFHAQYTSPDGLTVVYAVQRTSLDACQGKGVLAQ